MHPPLAHGIVGRRAQDEALPRIVRPDERFVVVPLEGHDREPILIGTGVAAVHDGGRHVVEREGERLHLERSLGNRRLGDHNFGSCAGNPSQRDLRPHFAGGIDQIPQLSRRWRKSLGQLLFEGHVFGVDCEIQLSRCSRRGFDEGADAGKPGGAVAALEVIERPFLQRRIERDPAAEIADAIGKVDVGQRTVADMRSRATIRFSDPGRGAGGTGRGHRPSPAV